MNRQQTVEQDLVEFSERAANYVAEMSQTECDLSLLPEEVKRLDEAIWEVLTSVSLRA